MTYNPETDRIPENDLLDVDRYLLNRLREFTAVLSTTMRI